jgi:hypothetical protein
MRSMDPPAIPLQFGALKRRSFVFLPPILNVEHNEWRLRKVAGSEMLVTNLKSDLEVWISKRLIGRISGPDEPLLTVSLLRELEYKAGSLQPTARRVLELPLSPGSAGSGGPQPGRGLTHMPGRPRGAPWLAAGVGAALIACCAFAAVLWFGSRRVVPDRDLRALTARDNYSSVVRRLGAPAREDLRFRPGEPAYRVLWYPSRACFVVLAGASPASARYIGALDRDGRVIHHVTLPGQGDSASLLRRLSRK